MATKFASQLSVVAAEPLRVGINHLLPNKKIGSLKVSIVTVAFNSEATINHTLESVARQTYGHIEHIVIDGGSKDATLDIIQSYPHIAHWISEPDKGIYDAMNKGIKLATGDIIGFLNSDDEYADVGAIQRIVDRFEQINCDAVYSDLEYIDKNDPSKVVRQWKSKPYKKGQFLFGWMPPHPTFYVRTEIIRRCGLFNIELTNSADYEMMLRIVHKHGFIPSYVKGVLIKMRAGGASNGSLKKHLKANRQDRNAWVFNNLKPYFFTLYLKPARKLGQFLSL